MSRYEGSPPQPIQTAETFKDWVRRRVAEQPYFFHKIRIYDDLVTPGWSDPAVDKLPYYGLPERLDGLRVLDIGCAEGFFSFEAERRGAAEVISIDSFAGSIERCTLLKEATGSKIQPYLCSAYDLSPRTMGTFDVVFFFGVLYHLRNPLYALEKIARVCTGVMLLQTLVQEDKAFKGLSISMFHPFGIESGPPEKRTIDPTVFWVPTPECARNLTLAAGFAATEYVTNERGKPFVLRATSKIIAKGTAPDHMTAPWS